MKNWAGLCKNYWVDSVDFNKDRPIYELVS